MYLFVNTLSNLVINYKLNIYETTKTDNIRDLTQ